MIPGLQVGDGVWFVCFGRLRRGRVLELARSRALLGWKTADGSDRRRWVTMGLTVGDVVDARRRRGFPVWGVGGELQAAIIGLEGRSVEAVRDALRPRGLL